MKILATNDNNPIVELATKYVGKDIWIAVYIVDFFGDYADVGYLRPISVDVNFIEYVLVLNWELTRYDFDQLIAGLPVMNHSKQQIRRRYVAVSPIELFTEDDLRELADAVPDPNEDDGNI